MSEEQIIEVLADWKRYYADIEKLVEIGLNVNEFTDFLADTFHKTVSYSFPNSSAVENELILWSTNPEESAFCDEFGMNEIHNIPLFVKFLLENAERLEDNG